MVNLPLKELRLTAKNRNINGRKRMSKDKILRIINNKKGDRNSHFKLKREEIKRTLYKLARNIPFK